VRYRKQIDDVEPRQVIGGKLTLRGNRCVGDVLVVRGDQNADGCGSDAGSC
jgi:hypothetical protein